MQIITLRSGARRVCGQLSRNWLSMRFIQQLKNEWNAFAISSQSVLVAVSGGADSVALLRGVISLKNDFALEIHVAHFDHQTRGSESRQDAEFVERLCDQLDVPCVVGRRPDESLPPKSENHARDLRYEFLISTAERLNCAFVLFAHHADDQAETVLHHILRGTGISGLKGIPASRPLSETVTLIRPMLKIPRALALDYLTEIEQAYREDRSNRDPKFTRNRIRNDLLPKLRDEFNPQVDAALLRLSGQAIEYQQLIDDRLNALEAAAILDLNPDMCRLNADCLRAEPPIIVRSLFVRLWSSQRWPRQSMGHAEWNSLADSLHTRQSFTLPGPIDATHRGNLLVLSLRS